MARNRNMKDEQLERQTGGGERGRKIMMTME